MSDVLLLRMALDSFRSSHQPQPQPVIQISSALATSEWNTNADWLPAASTCCSSGSRRINRARSFSERSLGRVLPCYMTAAAGVGPGGHAQRPVPAACSHPSSGRRGASKATTERAARIVCLPERDDRDSDLSCVPNEKRPLSAVDARYLVGIQRRVHLRAKPATAVACIVGGPSSLSARPLIHAQTLINS